jgi:hypothetical protein
MRTQDGSRVRRSRFDLKPRPRDLYATLLTINTTCMYLLLLMPIRDCRIWIENRPVRTKHYSPEANRLVKYIARVVILYNNRM